MSKKKVKYKKYIVGIVPSEEPDEIEIYAKNQKEAEEIASQIAIDEGMTVDYVQGEQ